MCVRLRKRIVQQREGRQIKTQQINNFFLHSSSQPYITYSTEENDKWMLMEIAFEKSVSLYTYRHCTQNNLNIFHTYTKHYFGETTKICRENGWKKKNDCFVASTIYLKRFVEIFVIIV